MLSYTDARREIIEIAGTVERPLFRESIEIEQAFGRILAEPVLADRDYPPFDRATRDGFAVRSADASSPGARLDCIGELRAGGSFNGALGPQQSIEIMTGAAIPQGADACGNDRAHQARRPRDSSRSRGKTTATTSFRTVPKRARGHY